jgi:hypothetical protein
MSVQISRFAVHLAGRLGDRRTKKERLRRNGDKGESILGIGWLGRRDGGSVVGI